MKYVFFEVTLFSRVGGVQTCAWNMAREFSARGKDVTIITGQGPLACPYDELRDSVQAFPYKPRERQTKLLGSRLPKILERKSLARAAAPLLAQLAPDSAIIFFKPHDVHALQPYLKICHQSCFHSQGTDFVPMDRRLFAKYVTRISACSNFNAWQISTHFKRPARVIYNGVPEHFVKVPPNATDREKWRATFRTRPETRVFAFAGRMVGWKGLGVFIKALSNAGVNGGITEELWLVGDGPDLQRWLDLAKSLGLGERVKSHPFVKHGDLPGLWDAVDIGVFPSSGDEAFGISIAEAMARGKPVIGSHVAGIPEVVGNEGGSGWLCANGDVDSFARAIQQSRNANLMQLGNNARERVNQLFRWPALAAQFLQFIG